MTALHVMWIASIAGALLFFAAGAAASALRGRGRRPLAALPEQMPAAVARADIDRLKIALRAAEVARAQAEAARAQAEVMARDAVAAQRRHEAARGSAEAMAHDATALRQRDEAATRELEALRARLTRAEAAARELETARARLARAEAAAREATSSLENARVMAAGTSRELQQATARIGELEGQLAAKTESVRDLSTENEHVKGRLRDAEALRAEYVRLRTSTTDAEYLKSEIARLQEELVATRAAALGAVRPRPRPPARGTERPATIPTGSIGESLATVLERFADAGTRSIAIGDRQGFVLASNGDDGTALAAHAAQLAEAASRAKSFLPFGTPAAIEVMDEHGARVSVWTFPADGEPLLLASLAVSAPEPKRVESALADLAAVLTPTPMARS